LAFLAKNERTKNGRGGTLYSPEKQFPDNDTRGVAKGSNLSPKGGKEFGKLNEEGPSRRLFDLIEVIRAVGGKWGK